MANIQEKYRKSLEEFVVSVTSYPAKSFEGKGIVICGGGTKYFTCAWVCINMLRELKCELPVELWYRGKGELNSKMEGLVSPLEVKCVNAYDVESIVKVEKIQGWELKIFAIVHSAFEEVIYIDADNVPVRDPSFLLKDVDYLSTGALFWSDRYQGEHSPEPWLKREAWDICGVPYLNEPEFESGQMVINKQKCWKPLLVTFHLNINSDYYYQWFYGDKDTFHLAWRKLDYAFGWIMKPPLTMEKWKGVFQHDRQGNVLFQHRNNAKWSIFKQHEHIAGFIHQEKCFDLIDRLKTKWNGKVRNLPFEFTDVERKAFGESLSVKLFNYHVRGSNPVTLELMHDFSIMGGGKMEYCWNIEEDKKGIPVLEIGSQDGPTCFLRQDGQGQWTGNWLSYGRQYVTLTPITSTVSNADCEHYYNLIHIQRSNFESYPSKRFSGKGIVIPGGGKKYFPCAWVLINLLRHDLKCSLPIELWYLGNQEMDRKMSELLVALEVTLRDASAESGNDDMHGWMLKPYSILNSTFSEVLFLDSDNVPIRNPDFLFELDEYKSTGALFWPDFGQLGADRSIWKICKVAYQPEPEFESGQMVLDKQRCWHALQLSLHMNMHSDFYYKHILGDKETFHMAWRILEQEYTMNPFPIDPIRHTMRQHDFSGNVLFQHRNYAKWELEANISVDGFLLEKECLGHLDRLAQAWNGNIEQTNIIPDKNYQHLAGTYMYIRIGHDKRSLELKEDGKVGTGNKACERNWSVKKTEEQEDLFIYGDQGLTCTLRLDADKVWKGRWHEFEKMQVHLVPVKPMKYLYEQLSHADFRKKYSCLKFPEKPQKYRIKQMYRKAFSKRGVPDRIYRVDTLYDLGEKFGSNINDIDSEVIFYLLLDEKKQMKWAKKYLGSGSVQMHQELELFDFLSQNQVPDIVTPDDIHQEYGFIYPFISNLLELEAFRSSSVENNDYLSRQMAQTLNKTKRIELSNLGFTNETLSDLCDFKWSIEGNRIWFFDFTLRDNYWISN